MATASPDPIAFLRTTHAFSSLPQAAFEEAARSLEVAFFPVGTRLMQRGGPPSAHLYLIRKGAVRLEREGQTVQVLEEGELFGFASMIAGVATSDVVVEEDLLAYRVPAEMFKRLLAHSSFSGYFQAGLAERLKSSINHTQSLSFQADMAMPVGELVRRAPVRASPDITVEQAARTMRDEHVGSLIIDGDPPGIITDRDLRNRVLAEGVSPTTKVVNIQSSPVRTVPDDTPVYAVWQRLLDEGYHHLPVTRAGQIVGVVTDSDLLRRTAQGPVAVMRRVERLPDRQSLPGYADQVAEMVRGLVAGGLDAFVISGLVARLNSTLVGRIIRWAEAELGAAPCPYAWVVFGSEGRQEQLLLTDQDNALIYADESPEAKAYFPAFASKVVEDLVGAGFPRCPGGYMATRWQGSLAEWESRFLSWILHPKPKALIEAHIFFDYRRVHGRLEVNGLDAIMRRAGRENMFLAALAKGALEFKPPPSLYMRLKSGSSKMDFKAQGISPLVFLARCFGLEAGTPARNSLERLKAAVDAGILSADTYATLSEAYRFFLRVRLRHQLERISAGERPNNLIALNDLTTVERSHLKEAFRAVADWQDTAAYHYRTELF